MQVEIFLRSCRGGCAPCNSIQRYSLRLRWSAKRGRQSVFSSNCQTNVPSLTLSFTPAKISRHRAKRNSVSHRQRCHSSTLSGESTRNEVATADVSLLYSTQ